MSGPESELSKPQFAIGHQNKQPAKFEFRIGPPTGSPTEPQEVITEEVLDQPSVPTLAFPKERAEEVVASFDSEVLEGQSSPRPLTDFSENEADPDTQVKKPSWMTSEVVPGDLNATIILQNASILLQHEEHEMALALFQKVIAKNSRLAPAIYGLARCFMKLNKLDQSLQCFSQLHNIENDYYSLYCLGNIHYLRNEFDQAYEIYLTVLQVADFDKSLLFELFKNLGNILLRSGEVEGAIDNYSKAYRLQPESDLIEVNLGTAKLQKDEVNEAILHFRRAVEINPKNDMAWVGLALIHRQFSDIELAWGNLERALDFSPDNKTAISLVMDWAVIDSRVEAVLPVVQNYLSVCDFDEEVTFFHAKALFAAGDLKLAKLELERAMAIDPSLRGGETLLNMIRSELGH